MTNASEEIVTVCRGFVPIVEHFVHTRRSAMSFPSPGDLRGMDQAPATWANAKASTARYDTVLTVHDRDARETYGILTPAALPSDVSEIGPAAFRLDDTFMPVRWKV